MTNDPSLQERYDEAIQTIAILKNTVRVQHGNINELSRLLDQANELIDDLRDYKWMYEELQ